MLGFKPNRRVQPKRLIRWVREPHGLNITLSSEHFYLLNVGLLTLSHPLRADVYGSFHSIGIDLVVALSSLAASLIYRYSVVSLNQAYK